MSGQARHRRRCGRGATAAGRRRYWHRGLARWATAQLLHRSRNRTGGDDTVRCGREREVGSPVGRHHRPPARWPRDQRAVHSFTNTGYRQAIYGACCCHASVSSSSHVATPTAIYLQDATRAQVLTCRRGDCHRSVSVRTQQRPCEEAICILRRVAYEGIRGGTIGSAICGQLGRSRIDNHDVWAFGEREKFHAQRILFVQASTNELPQNLHNLEQRTDFFRFILCASGIYRNTVGEP